MKGTFDNLDRQIIGLLQVNGRMPSTVIARKLNISERTARHRIDRMVKQKAILPTVVVNPRLFGYPVAVDIFCEIEMDHLDRISKKLTQYPEINYIANSFGDQDISIQALFKTNDEAFAFVQKLNNSADILRTKTVFVPHIIKKSHEWVPPEDAFDEY